MPEKQIKNVKKARALMEDFLERTGIKGTVGDPSIRYLWTDALAVQCCFALAHLTDDDNYVKNGLDLIDRVHRRLGQFRPDDRRTGWISGLSEAEGSRHPTAGGLRIGKRLPERKSGEPYDPQLEWDRDGQYFHYLTRWFHALLQTFGETGEKKYANWAAELLQASGKFLKDSHIYWKMNTDLSAHSIESMGAHDPLEGLVCVMSAIEALPEKEKTLDSFHRKMKKICRGMEWHTTDALGIGGLLINTARTAELALAGREVPEPAKPRRLYSDGLSGAGAFVKQVYSPKRPAESRLAFRECGLSLGIRIISGLGDRYVETGLNIERLEEFIPLADDIENFWLHDESRNSPTWNDHRDINAVTLAASLLAKGCPASFCYAP